ncbi:MAG: flagellar protein FlaG [Treponema sp.]|nr:flagellar protein FlaG [Treponema sp.]
MNIQKAVAINKSAYTQGSGAVRLSSSKTVEQKISASNTTVPSQFVSQDKSEPVNGDEGTKDLERISFPLNKKFQFIVDYESHEILVKVIDSETGKVVKILPPEELRGIHSKIKEPIGVLFDELM